LHWTKLNQNWNFMCAECHSTGVRKNYDATADRFATTWAEISVGCEACHGQGSAHLDWVRKQQSWWPFGKTDDPTRGLLARFDEVYNYGSFKQSKMFAAGVTCSDCHEPHGTKLRAPGDNVCSQCHSIEKYAATTHHRHEVADPPVGCASCHMPVRTHMVVDRR